jgi:hypothetical protein
MLLRSSVMASSRRGRRPRRHRRPPCRRFATHAVQGQPGTEQALHDPVVQVGGNAVTVVEECGAFPFQPGLGHLQRDRGLIGERGGAVRDH